MSDRPTLVWFRQDLRLSDNPALHAAEAAGDPVIPVFIWDPDEEAPWAPGSASLWWLHQSLKALGDDLARRGSRLVLRKGPTAKALLRLAREGRARRVYWNRRSEPAAVSRDTAVMTRLREEGYDTESFNAGLLFEHCELRTKQGRPYQVFTPFWNACRAVDPPPAPLPAPRRMAAPEAWPDTLPLGALQLEPTIDWAAGLRAAWTPGERGARERLAGFLGGRLADYAAHRDRPDFDGTSALSPHLHFGEISPRAVWHQGVKNGSAEVYLKELVWREFAHHLLYHFPHTADQPLRSEFAAFPWRDDPKALRAWQGGQTGYPFVDAGLRQLWATGWMHNRARMIAASFLVKHLLIPWQAGARWFWDTLVDADLANNTLGWQWTAGCGADAAPYFRIFNPVSQGEKFDPHGEYVRRWLPELARVPDRYIHHPWEAPPQVLHAAGVALGETYPRPIVDHAEGRERALQAFSSLSKPAK